MLNMVMNLLVNGQWLAPYDWYLAVDYVSMNDIAHIAYLVNEISSCGLFM